MLFVPCLESTISRSKFITGSRGLFMDSMVVPGVLDSLSAIGRYVLGAAWAAGLDKRAAYRLRLAVDEIATNAVLHGYQEAGL